jgi:hypothetical protein
MMRRTLALLAVLCATPAAAETWRASYTVTAAGIPILDATITLQIEGDAYRVETSTRTRGMASWVVDLRNTTRANGTFEGDDPRPREYRTDGVSRGRPRHVLIEYAGNTPRVLRAEPPSAQERRPVPEAETRGAVDQLSAMAKLIRVTQRTGRCDGELRVYDGRQLTAFRSRTAGTVQISEGSALRCDVETRALAGTRLDRDAAEAARPQPVTAWLGVVGPGYPPVPVRIELTSRWWGTVTASLVNLERG